MDLHDSPRHLGDISTQWQVLKQAHEGSPSERNEAQGLLNGQYRGAVFCYLRTALRDHHAAEDLTAEFFQMLVEGKFRNADEGRGSFRAYVKTVLFHRVSRYRQEQAKRRRERALPDPNEVADHRSLAEQHLDDSYRSGLLVRTWEALEKARPAFHRVLLMADQHPDLKAPEMARRLSRETGKAVTADAVRQTLRRARQLFGELLLERVAQSLPSPSVEALEEELRELNLFRDCRPALERYRELLRR